MNNTKQEAAPKKPNLVATSYKSVNTRQKLTHTHIHQIMNNVFAKLQTVLLALRCTHTYTLHGFTDGWKRKDVISFLEGSFYCASQKHGVMLKHMNEHQARTHKWVHKLWLNTQRTLWYWHFSSRYQLDTDLTNRGQHSQEFIMLTRSPSEPHTLLLARKTKHVTESGCKTCFDVKRTSALSSNHTSRTNTHL